jgi:hypothetical protein
MLTTQSAKAIDKTTLLSVEFLKKRFPQYSDRFEPNIVETGKASYENFFHDAIFKGNDRDIKLEFKHMRMEAGILPPHFMTYTEAMINFQKRDSSPKIYMYFHSWKNEDGSYRIDEEEPIWCINSRGLKRYIETIDLEKPSQVYKGVRKYNHNVGIFKNKQDISELFTSEWLLKNYI